MASEALEINGQDINPREINVENVMAMTARLAQLMAQEADFLSEMKVKAIEPLQKEKIWLTRALEMQLARVKKHPELLADISDQERDDMAELFDLFDEVKQENHRRILSAKEANQRMVEAITEVVNEQTKKGIYDHEGNPDYQKDSMSVTLNEKV